METALEIIVLVVIAQVLYNLARKYLVGGKGKTPQAPKTEWTCPECQAVNPSGAIACESCGIRAE